MDNATDKLVKYISEKGFIISKICKEPGTKGNVLYPSLKGKCELPNGWTEIDAQSDILPRNPHWWDIEPPIPRVAKGISNRVDRLKCLGNAVVPAQFYPIFMAISEIQKIEP
ncbi:MAG: hypothetical protein VB100_01775 [Angelakisella sp.]|nr:hypothetical protein [Angelakisella sp.]